MENMISLIFTKRLTEEEEEEEEERRPKKDLDSPQTLEANKNHKLSSSVIIV